MADLSDIPPHQKKRTMIKDRTGCVRTSTRNLPPQGFTYGMKSPPDPEGAGEVISNWVTADPSASKDSVRSHVHSNILAIKHGCVTAKAVRKFAEDHTHIRMKEILAHDANSNVLFEGPFGMKTKYAEETMDQIMQAKFTNFDHDDLDYPVTTSQHTSTSLPKPKPTRASEFVKEINRTKKEQLEKPHDATEKHFIMKKFQNVPGKLHLPRGSGKKSPTRNQEE